MEKFSSSLTGLKKLRMTLAHILSQKGMYCTFKFTPAKRASSLEADDMRKSLARYTDISLEESEIPARRGLARFSCNHKY